MIQLTQNFSFTKNVATNSMMVIKGDNFKFTKQAEESLFGYQISITAEETSDFPAGEYKYQILSDTGIVEQDDLIVIQNFALMDDTETVKSKNEQILEAIEAQLAGRATTGQQSMTVGDKSIGYMNINELLTLKDYFESKVKKEQCKPDSTNGGSLKYRWSLR